MSVLSDFSLKTIKFFSDYSHFVLTDFVGFLDDCIYFICGEFSEKICCDLHASRENDLAGE
jgi:hypothetical protein